jgi:hypothetical protein
MSGPRLPSDAIFLLLISNFPCPLISPHPLIFPTRLFSPPAWTALSFRRCLLDLLDSFVYLLADST